MSVKIIIGLIIVLILAVGAWNKSRLVSLFDEAVYTERLRPLNEAITAKDAEIIDLKKTRAAAEIKTAALKLEVARLLRARTIIDPKEVTTHVEARTAKDADLLALFERLYGVRPRMADVCR